MADRAALEMLCTARYRGFESRPLRHLLVTSAIIIHYNQIGKVGKESKKLKTIGSKLINLNDRNFR